MPSIVESAMSGACRFDTKAQSSEVVIEICNRTCQPDPQKKIVLQQTLFIVQVQQKSAS